MTTETEFYDYCESLPFSSKVISLIIDSSVNNMWDYGCDWDNALATAKMIADCPQDFYPNEF